MSIHKILHPTNSNLNTIRSDQHPYQKHNQTADLGQVKSNSNSKLFYIKSKHTQRYFRNHSYFLSNQNVAQNTKISVQSSSDKQVVSHRNSFNILSLFKKNKSLVSQKQEIQDNKSNSGKQKEIINKQRMKQFVNQPANFGIDNTYKYLKSKSFLLKSQHLITMKQQIKRQKQRRIYTQINQDEGQNTAANFHNYLKQTSSCQKRFTQTLKERKLSHAKKRLQTNKFLSSHQNGYNKQQTNVTQQKPLQSNKIYNAISLPDLNLSRANVQDCIQYNINFIYGVKIINCSQISYRTITLNVFPFIINSFLKCKIKYNQFNLADFQLVRDAIFKVIHTKKEDFDIKDIINFGSVKSLMRYLQNLQQISIAWIETIRYFFIAQQNILDYQFQKIKDQLRNLSALKFNAQLNSKEVYLFNVQTGQFAQTLFDVFKAEKLIFGDKKTVYQQYWKIISKRRQLNSLAKRINQWKSIAQQQSKQIQKNGQRSAQLQKKLDLDINVPASFRSINSKMSDGKFNSLFQISSRRHFKSKQKQKLSLKQFIKSSDFINKHKLKKDQSIFE